jgi:hypothetical protein
MKTDNVQVNPKNTVVGQSAIFANGELLTRVHREIGIGNTVVWKD